MGYVGILAMATKSAISFFLLIVFLYLIPQMAEGNSFKTQNLKYGINVDIPLGWKILPKNMLRQLDNATEARTGINQSNNEILIAANCYTLDKNPSATFRISVRKIKTELTQKKLRNFSDKDFKSALYDSINYALETDKLMGSKTDINTLTVFTARVDNLIALVSSKNIQFPEREEAHILYIIPTSYGNIKIYASFNKAEESVLKEIMIKILSSIKIGKK